MKCINYKDNHRIRKDVQKLFLSAFPSDERPPAHIFFAKAKKENNDVYAYYDNDEFIGFTGIITYKDIIYIFFLAVPEAKRNMGYGSKILEYIKSSHRDKVVLLCYEEVDRKYDDYEKRVKRKEFYQRNGFLENGFKTNEFGVIFETAYYGVHKVSFEEYVEIFAAGFGEFARQYIKKEN